MSLQQYFRERVKLLKVENVKIYDLNESIIASGYPMKTEIGYDIVEPSEKDLKRVGKLAQLCDDDNPAHGQFMTGIRVAFDLTCSNKMWVEAERYRFLEFVSSQSTMHRIVKFNLNNCYNEYVDKKIIDIMKQKVKEYNEIKTCLAECEGKDDDQSKLLKQLLSGQLKDKYLELLYNNPAGFELTARLTTNYRCLRNIYRQRQDHRLPEWREFCKWIETLPYFSELIADRSIKSQL